MKSFTGWLFDVYAHPTKGVVVWLLGEDGKPYSFYEDFETIFYARGSQEQLHEVGKFIRTKYSKDEVRLERVTTKEDLFDGPQVVMGIGTTKYGRFKRLFQEVYENFPKLIFYDVDVPFTVRYVSAHQVFMMARCEIKAQPDGKLVSIKALDTPEDLDPQLPHLRILSLRPDTDPAHASPQYLIAKFGKSFVRLPFERPQELLGTLNGILSSYDPDVIQTHFGDGWLLPHLLELSKQTEIPFQLNRDTSLPVKRLKEVPFFNYGRAHYRAPQVHLRGRWHVDVENGMTYKQYRLLGAIEQTRFSSLPLQEVARRSPGAAISAMQVLTAIRQETLVPYLRQKAEIGKSFREYYKAARGGLILQPTPGIFQNVGVLDFSSKMASIMIKYNISPETVVDIQYKGDGLEIPELGVKILSRPGLVPQALKPMRDKRLALKRFLKSIDKHDPRYRSGRLRYKMLRRLTNKQAISDSLKWLAVVCYGRLGFANAVFGRLNAHEAVSYLSRKMVIKAKLLAESMGFTVHRVYVDSVMASCPDATKEDFLVLAKAIEQETQLPMELENIYSWFAFLSSRQNPKVSVSNKFFGVAANGEHKIRGVALRRGDTCAFIANLQRQVIQMLAQEKDSSQLVQLLPDILKHVQEQLAALKSGQVPLEQLVVSQILSRELEHYSVLSPLAVAAHQLRVQGKNVRMGMYIRYIYVLRGPGVHAWDLSKLPTIKEVDRIKYRELTLRAVQEILQPLGITDAILKNWILGRAGYLAPPGFLKTTDATRLAVPLLADLKYLRLN